MDDLAGTQNQSKSRKHPLPRNKQRTPKHTPRTYKNTRADNELLEILYPEMQTLPNFTEKLKSFVIFYTLYGVFHKLKSVML